MKGLSKVFLNRMSTVKMNKFLIIFIIIQFSIISAEDGS